jgi:hypothetical protein
MPNERVIHNAAGALDNFADNPESQKVTYQAQEYR